MKQVTLFKNFVTRICEISFYMLAFQISSGRWLKEVTSYREALQNVGKEEATKLKQSLPAFTPSASFIGRKDIKNIREYTGVCHLDFDKLAPEDLARLITVVNAIPFTYMSFVSPSGNGLKVFVKVDSTLKNHTAAYLQVQHFYEGETGFKADDACKDVVRLCFISYDPNIYYNEDSEIVHIDIDDGNLLKTVPRKMTSTLIPIVDIPNNLAITGHAETFQRLEAYVSGKMEYKEGNRNKFVHYFACEANRRAILKQVLMEYSLSRFDLPNEEVLATIESTYRNNAHEFGNFTKGVLPSAQEVLPVDDPEKAIDPDESADYLRDTPMIDDSIIPLLPGIIASGAAMYTERRERDTFIVAAIVIISGCFPNVSCEYAGDTVFANLYLMVLAPAASGKSALKDAKELANQYHIALLDESKRKKAEYLRKKKKKKSKDDDSEPIGDPPNFEMLFIPADTSNSMMLWQMQQNNGRAIIAETEIDTLSDSIKQDWGMSSATLRCAFHHEKIASARRQNDSEYIEVDKPKLSLALSGTPNQISRLINSKENGLFSRFLFYAYKVEQRWKSVSPAKEGQSKTETLSALSKDVTDMAVYLSNSNTEVRLTEQQWGIMNERFSKWLTETTMFSDESSGSVIKRLGLSMCRICMVFTAMRKYESRSLDEIVYCTDIDFRSALKLIFMFLKHSMLIYNNLPKNEGENMFKEGDNKRNFFEALPNEFKLKEAIEVGKCFGMAESTVAHFLPKLVGKTLNREKLGLYSKIYPKQNTQA
ncbi:DUF3987 domain-containing protein [Parasediminibacterium sp. JCM 36343]|uniref:DUF3987 domain-containing protein n=1 Tax=Parasediminibacterium sp. JCM 36343 TaxID=3374279 RepID=UPI003979346E